MAVPAGLCKLSSHSMGRGRHALGERELGPPVNNGHRQAGRLGVRELNGMSPVRRDAQTVADLVPPPACEALLFDWDGTVANSQQVNFEVLRVAMAEHGLILGWGWFNANTGTSTVEAITEVARLQGMHVDVDVIKRGRDERFLERVDDVSIVPYIEALIDSERGHRKLAVASGGDKQCLFATLDALKLTSHFDAVVARDDVEAGKPDPEIFQAAALRVGVRPELCLVYEDSDEGLAAAMAAGMDHVDVRPLRMRVLGY